MFGPKMKRGGMGMGKGGGMPRPEKPRIPPNAGASMPMRKSKAKPMPGMAKGGAVPGKKMPTMMPMKSDKPAKMASKAMAKGKKMMPAFMKKGAR